MRAWATATRRLGFTELWAIECSSDEGWLQVAPGASTWVELRMLLGVARALPAAEPDGTGMPRYAVGPPASGADVPGAPFGGPGCPTTSPAGAGAAAAGGAASGFDPATWAPAACCSRGGA